MAKNRLFHLPTNEKRLSNNKNESLQLANPLKPASNLRPSNCTNNRLRTIQQLHQLARPIFHKINLRDKQPQRNQTILQNNHPKSPAQPGHPNRQKSNHK